MSRGSGDSAIRPKAFTAASRVVSLCSFSSRPCACRMCASALFMPDMYTPGCEITWGSSLRQDHTNPEDTAMMPYRSCKNSEMG